MNDRSNPANKAGRTPPRSPAIPSVKFLKTAGPSPWWACPAGAPAELRRFRIHAVGGIPHHSGESRLKPRCWAKSAYARLEDIPEPVDIVDIFRRSEFVPEIVESAIRIGARAVWMQEGVIHPEAAERARRAGLFVVMDSCILKEHMRHVRISGLRRRSGIAVSLQRVDAQHFLARFGHRDRFAVR